MGDRVKSLSEIKNNLISGKATLTVTDDIGEGDKQLRNRGAIPNWCRSCTKSMILHYTMVSRTLDNIHNKEIGV